MSDRFDVVIVGGGPAGIGATVAAAQAGLKHLLLERADHIADTIYRYQKRKEVMAHPERLPLLSEVPFGFSSREQVLEGWEKAVKESGANVRLNAEVVGIKGTKGDFTLTLADKSTILAAHVVLGIGLQGNLRRLGVPGQDRPWVQYELADPDAYRDEDIVVVGGGDAGIENALALAEANRVAIINRQSEFARAKAGNLAGIERAIRLGKVTCYYSSSPTAVEDAELVIATAEGEARLPCNRVIARLGANPPRKFVEQCGIEFPSSDPAAVPRLSASYESNVPGLYVVGALAGYQLIKEALNQGYEVVQTIRGKPCEPADYQILKANFAAAFPGESVDAVLALTQSRIAMLSGLTLLQLREFLLDSPLKVYEPGEVIFHKGDYRSSIYSILEGKVAVAVGTGGGFAAYIGTGEFFGELGLLSGRRRSATICAVDRVVVIETPRRSLLRLMSSVDAVREEIDRVAVRRTVHTVIGQGVGLDELEDVIGSARLEKYAAQQPVMCQGDPCDAMYLVRRGSVTISVNVQGKEVVLSHVAAGDILGERGILTEGSTRSATAKAAIASELLRIDAGPLRSLMFRYPALRQSLEQRVQRHYGAQFRRLITGEDSGLASFLVEQGVAEATNVLLIDESLCVRCNNCENACAETHGGISRLDREAGATYAQMHVPIACRHCETPHCMTDCPPDAIHRAPSGEVFIADNCIGCGNCERNCPYGVVHLSGKPPDKPGFLSWLLFGTGPGPGDRRQQHREKSNGSKAYIRKDKPGGKKLAVKCDLCRDVDGGPACVRSCPTGATFRANPEEVFSIVTMAQGGSAR